MWTESANAVSNKDRLHPGGTGFAAVPAHPGLVLSDVKISPLGSLFTGAGLLSFIEILG